MAGGDRGGDGMGLLMLACVSLETFAITDHLWRRFFGEVVAVDDVGLIDAMDWQMDWWWGVWKKIF